MTAVTAERPLACVGCRECRAAFGTAHLASCPSTGYVEEEEASLLPVPRSAATAVTRMLDGELVPTAGPPDPIRRCELAAIWLAEATAELSDAIIDAKDAGREFREVAMVLGMTPEGVRQRYMRAKAHRVANGGSAS